MPAERTILRHVLIATTLVLVRELLVAFKPLFNWRGLVQIRYEIVTGAMSLTVVVLFVYMLARGLPGLALPGLRDKQRNRIIGMGLVPILLDTRIRTRGQRAPRTIPHPYDGVRSRSSR